MSSSSMSSRRPLVQRFRRAFALPALLAAMLILPGCGNVKGTYTATDPDGGGGKMTMELKDDNVVTMAITGPEGMNLTQSGTYTVEGDKIIVTVNGNREELTIKGSTITADFLGEKVELKKQ